MDTVPAGRKAGPAALAPCALAALLALFAPAAAMADCGLDDVDIPTQSERHLARSVRIVAEAKTIPTTEAMDAAETCNEIIRQLSNIAVRVGDSTFPDLSLDTLMEGLAAAAWAVMNEVCAYAYETGETAIANRVNTYTNLASYLKSNPVQGITGLGDGSLSTSLASSSRISVSAPTLSSASTIASRLSRY